MATFAWALMLAIVVSVCVVGDAGPNKYGIGLVNEGSATEMALAAEMAGQEGWVLLTFAGIWNDTTAAHPEWVAAVNTAYAHQLQPVIRLSPPWGQSHYRDLSDDTNHRSYLRLAQIFKVVVAGLPLVGTTKLYLQIDNEPDLCYEWYCGSGLPQPLSYIETAAEYASFLRDVTQAIRSLGDQRLQVSMAALAPGGGLQCGCCGSQNCPGDKPGITGLQFMGAMEQAVPGIFEGLDFLASHSYPASGIGFGFNVPFDQAGPGLGYYHLELKQINRTNLPVLITETGWASKRDGLPPCTESQKANWTASAWSQVWNPDPVVVGVMPFMLQDKVWGDEDGYGYVLTDGTRLPVFSAVKQQRCSAGLPPAC